MVTVVSKEVYNELNKKVSEAEPKKQKFDYKDFKNTVIHYSIVNDYLKDKDIKYVGKGSGRTVYMIPKGSCVGHEDSAVCLKVANGVKGIAQNKGEVHVIEKFGGKSESCFPELFETDKNGNISLLCELGRRIESFNELKAFFKEWNRHFFESDFDKTLERNGLGFPSNQQIEKDSDFFAWLSALKRVKRSGNAGKPKLKAIFDELNSIVKENPKYESFLSLLRVMFEKDAVYEVSLGDFGDLGNWAFIDRNGKDVLVPIDWGLTEEVKFQYYI